MVKKSILGLGMLVGILLTGTAQAQDIPEGFKCSDIYPNFSRVNPTELSDYQKCILSIHKAEEVSGTMGSLFWVKFEDKYYSMPWSYIRKAGGKDAAKARLENYLQILIGKDHGLDLPIPEELFKVVENETQQIQEEDQWGQEEEVFLK